MEIAGTVLENLKAAVVSARRHSDHPVHRETIQFWRDLLSYARQERTGHSPDEFKKIDQAIGDLENALAERG